MTFFKMVKREAVVRGRGGSKAFQGYMMMMTMTEPLGYDHRG